MKKKKMLQLVFKSCGIKYCIYRFHEYYPAGYIPNVYEKGVYEMFGPFRNTFKNERPAAVYGPMNNISMIIQRVAFTVFPYTMPLADMRAFLTAANICIR